MKKLFILLTSALFFISLNAQQVQRYKNSKGESHLCGSLPIEILENDTIFKKWYHESYRNFKLSETNKNWSKNLKDVEVEIFLGTWCGDTKDLVPKFVNLWDNLGLKRSQLKLIALYDIVEGKYKQGPNNEEKGKDIHRVPTFIFRKDNKEIARIVESPNNSLETDIAQIALGFPSVSNYRAAYYMLDLFKSNTNESIKSNITFINKANRLVKKANELNSLGYVLFGAGKIEEAKTVLYYNTLLFPQEPNVYDSYGEILAKTGNIQDAIINYEKVLLLDRSNVNAIEQLNKLKKK